MVSNNKRYNRILLLFATMFIASIVGKSAAVADDKVNHSVANSTDFEGETFSRLTEKDKYLLKEYRENDLRLKQFYSNITIEVNEKIFQLKTSPEGIFPPAPDADVVLTGIRDYTFRANGGNYYRMDGSQFEVSDPSKILKTTVGIVTPSMGSLLNRNLSSGEYYLKGHGKDADEFLDIMSVYCFYLVPFSEGPVSLADLLLENYSDFIIEKVEILQDSGDEIVRITAGSKSNEQDWSRHIVSFYRNRSWAVKDIRREIADQRFPNKRSVMKQSCIYRGEQDGVPLLHKCTIKNIVKDVATNKETLVLRTVYEIKEITPGPVELSMFDAELLIPMIGETKPFPAFRIASVGVGLFLLVFGIYLRRKRM